MQNAEEKIIPHSALCIFSSLDCHQLGFFFGCQVIDILASLICQVLQLLLHGFLVVLGELAVLLHLFEIFHGVPANITDGHLALLAVLADLFTQFFTALLRELGKANRITRPSFWGLMPRSEV